MITMGTVGQLIFRKYLTQNKVDFDFQLQAGEFDDFDFVIKNKIVEIKTSGFAKPNDWQSLNGIYNLSQLKAAKKKNYYCSVQLFVNGYDKMTKMFNVNACDTCIIAGWSLIEQIPSFPLVDLPYGKAHLIPLNELRDITDLISL